MKKLNVNVPGHAADDALLFEKDRDARSLLRVPRVSSEWLADIDRAVEVMRGGGVILYPTDTVWGIGCDAANPLAIRRIYDIKHRDDHKAMISLVSDLPMLERTVDGIPDVAYDLIAYSDRPLTIVYDRGIGVDSALMGPDSSLAVRLTREPFSANLVRSLRRPVVSTSANVSGAPAARVFADISPEILSAVDYVCSSRRNESSPSVPSMVIRLSSDGRFSILRK